MVPAMLTSIAAFLLVAVCKPVAANLDTPNPDELGTFAVGLKQAILFAPGGTPSPNPTGLFCPYSDFSRILPVDVWYPSTDDTTGLLPATINQGFPLQGVFNDLTPIDKARPLVIFSHGNFGTSFDSFFIAQALASHGFVVAVPSHVGNTAADQALGTPDPECEIRNNRPRDISAVIGCMLTNPTAAPNLPSVDGDAIAVAGHSRGSFSALTAAGGYDGSTESPCDDGSVVAYEADTRVKAIVPISLFIDELVSGEIESIDVPTLFLSGTQDFVTPVLTQTDPAWDRLSTQQAYRVDIIDAGHTSFTNTCDFLAYLSFLVFHQQILLSLLSWALFAKWRKLP